MRQLVSYEDITLPYELTASAAEEVSKLQANSSSNIHKSQSNKRKRKAARKSTGNLQQEHPRGISEEGNMEMSRELTHEEIWDDSALIEAWNAATEEYEAYNGPDKGWKSEPTHKSALWYNVPPAKKAKLANGSSVATRNVQITTEKSGDDYNEDDNSHPLDFDTFVPNHDPALEASVIGGGTSMRNYTFQDFSEAPESMVSRDEAFNRALNAMYWTGYWTAMYHSHSHRENPSDENDGLEDEDVEDEVDDDGNEADHDQAMEIKSSGRTDHIPGVPLPKIQDFVSTQR